MIENQHFAAQGPLPLGAWEPDPQRLRDCASQKNAVEEDRVID